MAPGRGKAAEYETNPAKISMEEQPLVLDPDAPSHWTQLDFAAFVAGHRWTFARTMPQNPHEYTLRRDTTNDVFDAAVRYIREHGVIELFWGKRYRSLFFDDHKYWTMGEPVAGTVLINRKLLPDAGGPAQ
jgi:hypothetical protein